MAGRALFQAGRVLDRSIRRARLAEPVFRAANYFLPDRPHILFRIGRIRERAEDWAGAEAAYSAAVALTPTDLGRYLVRRAHALERLGRWHDALADCRATPETALPERLVRRLVNRLRREGRLDEAFDLLARPLVGEPTSKYYGQVGDCYADLGSFAEACRAYRKAVDLAPEDLNILTNFGKTAARWSLMPFTIVDNGLELATDEERRTAFAEAVAQLHYVIGASDTRVWAAYWLGSLQESHGKYADAAGSYDLAISRVQGVDKPWAHNAKVAWTFRRTYVEQRMSNTPADDVRLNRTVNVGVPSTNILDRPGYFEASVTAHGLHIEGLLIHGTAGSVELCLDGRPIISTAGNQTGWHRDFKLTLVHDVLAEFPTRSTLTLRVGGNELATFRGACSVEVIVPDGRGGLFEMLIGGRTITKKGRWADAGAEARDREYLAAYAKARAFFEKELGIKLFLSYGTLLGCYRDGRLIPGDDDFDVSFVSRATSPEEFREECRLVIKKLLRGGFDSRVAVDGRMFHLRVDDVVLDVNPFWFYNGRAWSFDAHELDHDVFDPPAVMNVDGFEVYIPAKAELFLAENYGLDWRTPRSDFQYHRAKADRAFLRRVRLGPSEVRALTEYSERLLAVDPSAGRFHGYGDPARPGFH
jgi:tetratricopeptide (TPR) repeat protein